MKSISIRYPRTIFLIMFLLVGLNSIITTITAATDDYELHVKMNIDIARKLGRVPPVKYKTPPPIPNRPGRSGPPHMF
ncbi:hypothetical protein MKW94_010610 [Papaver nudicaule]|uniref:Uncharacterized protein n=1 Tax=Papaver nudicaule TaxID=74823 RepID=A0AA42AYV3_PAPNU|nr:hypothetical protein [Papaver nudicaule]